MHCENCEHCNWWNVDKRDCEHALGFVQDQSDTLFWCDNFKFLQKKIFTQTVIEHQDYYNWVPDVECLDVIKHFPFQLGSIIKYCWRCGKKEGESRLKDLEKALVYLKNEIEDEKKKQSK